LGASDSAGLVGNELGNGHGGTMVGNWNNLSGNTGSGVGSLTHSAGAVVDGVTVSWSADNVWSLPSTTGGANTSANTTMMKGYLDNGSENNTSITVSGLEAVSGSYSVILYMDADNGDLWTRGEYTIGVTTVLNEDSEGINFNSGSGQNANGVFQLPDADDVGGIWPVYPDNNSEGNMIIFSGLTGSSFTLTADPVSGQEGLRAPVNGMQIVGVVPEPASALLLVGGFSLICLIRRRFAD
jgi:hypothetical protein